MNEQSTTSSGEAAAYQDNLIHAALPAWIRAASIEQLQQLQDASSLSLYWRERCQQLLAPLQGVEAFCRPLLQQALQARWPALDTAALVWRHGEREPVVTSMPIGVPVTVPVYRTMPLLEAALRNFNDGQSEEGGMLVGNRLQRVDDQPAPELPSAAQFAAFCRQLDLGAQYQQHLRSVLEPDAEAGEQARSVLARQRRYALLVDAQRAWIEGAVDAAEHQLLTRLCGLHWPLTLNGDPLKARRLNLLGCDLEQIVVLDARDQSWSPLVTSSRRVIAWIPGDPHTPLRSYPSLRHFANDLGHRLRTAEYQRFFSRFVRRRDSQRFFSAVISGYDGVTDLANIALDEHMSDWPTPLFDSLAAAHIAQIKDDAALLATPVAELDRQVQREHDQRLAAEGWALLNLAGLFVPGLGLALLAVTAWQVLDEVYLGVEAWREGDHSEAMDHLCNVALDVASAALVAAGGSVVARVWTRSAVVDELLPHTLPDARVRLGQPMLEAFRSTPPAEALRDSQGVYRAGERCWVSIDGHAYEATPGTDQQPWTLRRRNGLAPALRHNGAGAWRLWFEQPRQWQDAHYLFRRLALSETRLNDEEIDIILHSTYTSAEHLRALHVHDRPADALLRDSTQRVALVARIRRAVSQLRQGLQPGDLTVLDHARSLPGAAELSDQALAERLWSERRSFFQRLYHAVQDSPSAQAQVLRRDFPGLSVLAAEELVAGASPTHREQLLASARVPLAMATRAQRSVRALRVSRALAGLSLETEQSLDLARLSLHIGSRLPGAPGTLRWRLFDGSRERFVAQFGAIDPAPPSGTVRQLDLLLGSAGFELFDAGGQALGNAADELFNTLALAYDDAERTALGIGEPFAHNLRVLIARQARQQPEQVEQALGLRQPVSWFRLPARLADGRLGYPLSGRGGGRGVPRALYARVRMLYPMMSDAEIEHWTQQLRSTGQQVERVLNRLGGEMQQLEGTLRRWVTSGSGLLARIDRSRFCDQLLGAWRRMTPRLASVADQSSGYRLRIYGTHLPSLPSLPEAISFAHVDVLSLRDVGLSQMPTMFLRSFPGLRTLELSGNLLAQLPQGIERLGRLRELALENNLIHLDAEQAARLAACEHLRTLNLGGNPLGFAVSVQRMSQLRTLNLRETLLPSLPEGLLESTELLIADLRGNQIRTLPERFFRAPRWLTSTLMLEDNPLEPAAAARLAQLFGEPQAAGMQVAGTLLSGPWLDTVEPGLRAVYAATWDALAQRPAATGLFELLQRLQQSADFLDNDVAMGRRVWSLLEAAERYPELGEELFNLANLPLTCQDSAALSFSGLELHLLVWQARLSASSGGGSEERALLHLGRQLWRLDEVERIALADLQARHADGANPDQIEVALAYRVGLREVLDLPAQPQDMLFAGVSGVDQGRLEQARDQVLAAETVPTLAASLVQREFWQTWLEQRYAERLQALDEPFQARLAALMDEAEAGTSEEGQYLEQMNRVRDERQAARHALLLTLTEQLLAAHLAT
ncbi:NEL-type E3 ubiquitin ligase domain-containing protein [Pseudomonas cremoricolorata]|uniref:NEL-type E3 ubiquitin ligase domain-containing protein n=1 Tax=Pseudomonas cremoricolorata TaxID=157783 RepID=UPI0004201367|nr:NEL-type E3 ubiquitin ligase domain-containing protein [Pseudomonas cremoricolorata]